MKVVSIIPANQIKVIIAEWAERNGDGWDQSNKWVGVNPDDVEIIAVDDDNQRVEVTQAIIKRS